MSGDYLTAAQKSFLFRESASYGVFREFALLQEAISYSNEKGGLPVFARDVNDDGAKAYIVTNYDTFLIEYAEKAPSQRNYYEVLVSGRKTDAYLDLEFPILQTYSEDFNAEFKQKIENAVASYFVKRNLPKPIFHWAYSHVPSVKYSAHVRIEILNFAFDGPETVGKFLADFDLKPFECKLTDGSWGNSIDITVYNQNRCFRLPYSSKRGVGKVTLIPGVAIHAQADRDFMGLEKMMLQRLAAKAEFTIADDPLSRELAKFPTRHASERAKSSPNSLASMSSEMATIGDRIGEHIASEWKKFDPKATVTVCDYASDRETFIFSSNSLYCVQKGITHKTNHVFFRANLRAGTFQQGCFDREGACANNYESGTTESGGILKRKREASGHKLERDEEEETDVADTKVDDKKITFTAWSAERELPEELVKLAHEIIYSQISEAEETESLELLVTEIHYPPEQIADGK